jgi:D-3-phosphoglycerate dehydrogenase
VLVTSRSFSSGDLDLAGELTEAGCQIVTGPSDHDLDMLRPQLASATAWVAGTGPVTADHLDAAPKLQLVARYGVGVEAVDLAAATERGILVTNTPGANSGAVADHTMALILAGLRDVAAGDRGVRVGRWAVRRTRQLGQLTVGIVGLGRIGREVASRLGGFGSTLLGYDPWVPQPELDRLGIERVDLDELARRSDVITLHAPGDAVLVDVVWLGLTRSHLVLVNTARAGLVDEAAVADALRADRLRIYATDVLGTEAGSDDNPLLADDLADHTLFTPHAAAQTVEAVDQMGRGSVDAVLAHLRGEQPPNLVLLPQRNPPQPNP